MRGQWSAGRKCKLWHNYLVSWARHQKLYQLEQILSNSLKLTNLMSIWKNEACCCTLSVSQLVKLTHPNLILAGGKYSEWFSVIFELVLRPRVTKTVCGLRGLGKFRPDQSNCKHCSICKWNPDLGSLSIVATFDSCLQESRLGWGRIPHPTSPTLRRHNGGVCCQKLDQTKAASDIDWFRLSWKLLVWPALGVMLEGRGHWSSHNTVCNEGQEGAECLWW